MAFQLLLVAIVASSVSSALYIPPGLDKKETVKVIMKYMENVQWQSLHMAAAAACRGSTFKGEHGPRGNYVYPQNYPYTCNAVCGAVNMVC